MFLYLYRCFLKLNCINDYALTINKFIKRINPKQGQGEYNEKKRNNS